MRRLIGLGLLAVAALFAGSADQELLARIPKRLQEFADEKSAAGYVMLVAHEGKIVLHEAVGLREVESGSKMTKDAIFRIASMTKPITATAVMMLAEEGRLSPVDAVEKHLPEFRGQKMILSRDGDRLTFGPPSRAITIRDLLTHTSGMPGRGPEGVADLFLTRDRTLAEGVALYSQVPLDFEPGSRWQYSNTGIATLGRIVEVVSGMSYEEFLSKRIFEPLGMRDTHVFPPADKRGRLAPVYESVDGKLEPGSIPLEWPAKLWPAPEGGLHSTAADLVRFYQMFLNGGELDGVRIVSPGTVELMTRNHTGELTAGFAPGMAFGYGWTVVRNVDGTFRGNSIGTYGHGGAWRTYAFVDPVKKLIGILLFQKIGGGGDVAPEINAFIQMANAALLP
jgi:CubicO group peptidase (beta-lactamase class C family)